MEFNFFDLIIIALFVYRLSFMLTSEDGSFSITYAIRLIGMKPVPYSKGDENEKLTKWQAFKDSFVSNGRPLVVENHIGKLLSCIFCTSVWVGILAFPFYTLAQGTVFIYLFYGMAASATTMLINKELNRR